MNVCPPLNLIFDTLGMQLTDNKKFNEVWVVKYVFY